MSVRPPNDTNPYLTDDVALGWATVSAAARGCTCNAEVTIRRDGSLAYVTVAHDDWCPVLEAGAA